MSTEPEQICAEIAALLAQLPDIAADGADLTAVDLDEVAARLEEAHEVLVRALNAIEMTPARAPAGGAVMAPGTDG
jgi:hypothetical protein